MTLYCKCAVCKASPAQPKDLVQGSAEIIPGDEIYEMQEGSKLVHWSNANFEKMQSREIHLFEKLGNLYRTGCSFYYYTENVPQKLPKQLELMGLGGAYRYTIDPELGKDLLMYKKVEGNPQEVAVVVGCGGYIKFNAAKQAIEYRQVGTQPFM